MQSIYKFQVTAWVSNSSTEKNMRDNYDIHYLFIFHARIQKSLSMGGGGLIIFWVCQGSGVEGIILVIL